MVNGFRGSGSQFIVYNVISDTVFIELAVRVSGTLLLHSNALFCNVPFQGYGWPYAS